MLFQFFKKILNWLYSPKIQKIIEIAMLVWVIVIIFLYSNYHGNPYLISNAAIIIFIFLLFPLFIYGPKKKIKSKKLFQFLLELPFKKQRNIKFKFLFFLFPLLAVIVANIFLFDAFFVEPNLKKLLFYEANIFYKIFSIYFFYCFLIFLIYGIGKKMSKLLKLKFNDKTELFLFSIGLGFIPLMLGVFLIAILGWLYSWAVGIMIFLLALFSCTELKKTYKELKKWEYNLSFLKPSLMLKNIIILFVVLMLAFNFVSIYKPVPTDSDSMHTYFNAPNLYVDSHQFKPLRYYPHSNMGQNNEMIYAAIMSILPTAFIIHLPLLFFILCLIGFYNLSKHFFGEKHAALALATVYFIPFNYFFISTSKTDLCLAFYSVLMLYAAYLWHKKSDSKFLYILGVFAGIGIGIKYNAAFLILPLYSLILILLITRYKNDILKICKPFLISIFLAIVFFSPWAIKNQYLFNSIIHPYSLPLSMEKTEIKAGIAEYKKVRDKEIIFLKHDLVKDNFSITIFLKNIWHQSIGKNTLPAIPQNFGFIPLLIIPFYFLFKPNKKIIYAVSLSMAYFIIWYLTGRGGAWYAYSGFLLLYALLPSLLLRSPKLLCVYIPFAVLLSLPNITYLPNSIEYLKGAKNKQEFINESIPFYETAKYINNLNLDSNSKIAILGDFKAAFIERNDEIIEYIDPYFVTTGYYLNKGEKYFLKYLNDNSIDYIIHSDLCVVYDYWFINKNFSKKEYLDNYDEQFPNLYQDIDNFHDFLDNNTTIAYEGNYYTLYKLYSKNTNSNREYLNSLTIKLKQNDY